MMKDPNEKMVPKVHPATREVEPEDPMELHALEVPGDPQWMLECVVQEYIWMGWNEEQILQLFRNPFYPALQKILHLYGEEELRSKVQAILQNMGVFQVSTVVTMVEAEEDEELVQLGINLS